MVPIESPACNLSLATSPYLLQLCPNGYSLRSTPPLATISLARSRFSFGYIESQSRPLARNAVVQPLTDNAPRCAEVSQPTSRPDTTLYPRLENSEEKNIHQL